MNLKMITGRICGLQEEFKKSCFPTSFSLGAQRQLAGRGEVGGAWDTNKQRIDFGLYSHA